MPPPPTVLAEKAEDLHVQPFDHPSGGWTSIREVTRALLQSGSALEGARVLLKQNKPDGFACVSCSWAKPADPHPAEFCEHGAKATAWELTTDRCTPEFFAHRTVSSLEACPDLELESNGRLTAPMRWDAATDTYVECDWAQAFEEIGAVLRQLRAHDPKSVVFYTSGRASLETAYLYQLFARIYGNNNLPDSSNMCHESTSVGLPKSIGAPVGTVTLHDFPHADCLFIAGHNVGTNSPRMLHDLQAARERGVPIIIFNPLREPGLVHFANPQSPVEMLSAKETAIATQYLQVRPGGDLAALSGVCKALVRLDDLAGEAGAPPVLDHDFIRDHTHGIDDFVAYLDALPWDEIEARSGLARTDLEAAAVTISKAKRVIGIYGMGLTQHREGVHNVQMVANLLLLGGHVGRQGAGILPVRGHSNVQGQRTVGITEKPELAPLEKLKTLFDFEPPREKGLTTVEMCEQLVGDPAASKVKAVIQLGGNLLRAVPDSPRVEAGWRELALTVNVATKLNRSHVVHGKVAYLLPCLGRIEIDRQAGGEQVVSMEDSTGCMHGSRGQAEPASALLRSEAAIVAGIAKATVGETDRVRWTEWVEDYARVRTLISRTWPDIFHDMETRMWMPGGFHRPLPANRRIWKTETGKANFLAPEATDEDPDMDFHGADVLRLTTLRSFDQFNTTVYGLHDRYRGIHGTRHVLMMNAHDIARHGLADGQLVRAATAANDGVDRHVDDLRIVAYDIPEGAVAGYFPELNPLVPLWHHAKGSRVPAYKSVPIRVAPMGPSPAASKAA
jgi:molybdopterin-dependent oxidoreductase alpha subunit